MEIENHTPYAMHLFRSTVDEEHLALAIVCRVCCDVTADGSMLAVDEPRWPLSPGPWEGPYGPMDSDDVYRRGGVDLLVFATARAPGGEPTPAMRVALSGPGLRKELLVQGERRWCRRLTGIEATPPESFVEIPLTLANAYGGTDRWDGLDLPYVDNPGGKGFALGKDGIVDKPLPNIEDPQAPIRSWVDQPLPVGICPCPQASSIRVRGRIEVSGEGLLTRLDPAYYNAAFPDLVLPQAAAGDRFVLSGVRHEGEAVFVLPAIDLRCELRFAEQVVERPLRIDQIGLEVDAWRAFLTYRYHCNYRFVPRQRRGGRLFLGKGGR